MFRRLFRLGAHSFRVASWSVWDVMAEYMPEPRDGGKHRDGESAARIVRRLRFERERRPVPMFA